jgi:hypothetical protein
MPVHGPKGSPHGKKGPKGQFLKVKKKKKK